MRRKEIAEIRKQFSLENCNITRIDTTLITQGEITTRQQQTFLNLDNDDLLKYLGIFKKTLSGELGKNLLNLKFRAPEPEMSWGFLQQIRDSGLKDEDLIVLATESNIMHDAGAPEEELEKLTAIPPEQCPSAEILTNSKKIEITARDITITLPPENSGAVRFEEFKGDQWISIELQGDIKINGVSIRKENADDGE